MKQEPGYSKRWADERLRVVRAEYDNPAHAAALVRLLDAYARDPMGGGKAIPAERLGRLAGELGRRSDAFSVLAFLEDQAIGLVNCFESFSTFACRPLVNVHDVVVDAGFRGRGVASAMLGEVERVARERGCCKLTLEVLEGNGPARHVYRRFGFSPYQLRAEEGQAVFWEKPLED